MVDWNAANQTHWNTKLQPWLLDTAKQRGPTTLEMFYVQEDLWVLETLLNIVRRTNGGADHRSDAAIKSLEYIYMGSDLAELLRDPNAVGEGGEEAGYPGASGGYPTGDAYTDETSGVVAIDPADNRYVDRDYRPLSGKDVRSVYQETDPDKVYLRVAKRVPIQMRFTISHKRLPVFLAECANSPLVVEVREVQVNRPARGSAAGSEGYGSGVARNNAYSASAGFGGLQASPGANTFQFGGSGSGSGYEDESSQALSKSGAQDVPVEVFGIVLIYNPVDRKTLEVAPEEADGGDVAADASLESKVSS